MSFNQSRSDRSETQYRKPGRSTSSNQQRSSSGAYGKGSGGGPAPSPSITPASSLSSNRSFKKYNNNAQSGQSRVSVPAVNSSESGNASATRNIQNGAHVQSQLHGVSDSTAASGPAKPIEASAPQRGIRAAVPKASTSQSATVNSESGPPTTPTKVPGDASKAFPFQFGSISPGFMNGMQIPARTSSAPPNLDEQKRDQARHDTLRSVPPVPMPVSKQQLPRKDQSAVEQSNTVETLPVPKTKKDTQVSPVPSVNQTQKPSVVPIPITSMPMPFHQQQVSMQFGGPNQQMQSQGVAATSLQMPMPMLPMGNSPQVQQPVFVQSLQHPMPPQGIMHQGFTAQMGQLPPQLGNLGMTMSPQYPQQQGGKFGGGRKTTVKITHPETHEELRLDKRADTYSDGGSSGPRSHPNVSAQSQPIPSFTPQPMNYYPGSYNSNSIYFSAQSSLPLTSSQMTPNTQAPRFNYPVNQGPQNVSFMNPSALNSLPVNKTRPLMHGIPEQPNLENSRDLHNLICSAPSGTVQVTVKPAAGSIGEKVLESSFLNSTSAIEKSGSPMPSRPSSEATSSQLQRDSETSSESSQQPKPESESLMSPSLPVATKQPAPVSASLCIDSPASNATSSAPASLTEDLALVVNTEGRRKESLSRSNSIKDHQRKPGKKGHIQAQHQVGGQSTSIPSLPSHSMEHGVSAYSGVCESVETKTSIPLVNSECLSDSVRESESSTGGSTCDGTGSRVVDSDRDSFTSISSEISGAGIIVDTSDTVHHGKLDDPTTQKEPKHETLGMHDHGGKRLPEAPMQDTSSFVISSIPVPSKSPELVEKTERESVSKATSISNEVPNIETAHRGLDEPVSYPNDRMSNSMDASSCSAIDSVGVEKANDDDTLTLDATSCKSDAIDSDEVSATELGISVQQPASVPTPEHSEATLRHEAEGPVNTGSAFGLVPASGSKDKTVLEPNRAKSTATRGKKKRKEILLKADAAGTNSDLYMAYKGPEEKKETPISSESMESTSTSVTLKQVPADSLQVDALGSEKIVQNKAEPDDWEDAADISTPKLEASDSGEQAYGGLVHPDNGGNGNMAKKYSRDFLLKFSEQCTDLPEGFEIASDIAEALMIASASISHLVDRDSYPSPGRIVDRTSGGSRIDRRGSGVVEDDRWSKLPGPFGSGRDLRVDIGYGGNAGFRPGQGGNYGVLRNPRAQTPVQYAGGILSGPMQSMGSQGGMQRNSPDVDRWQRANSFQQKGLIPSPQTPLQMMHKAERKYEVGKVTDEEQAKQRQLKAILNKLTPQNFEKLFEQVKAVNIDNAGTLTGVISQIFDKALMEPTFCEMYANFCSHLAGELPDFIEGNEKITFKRMLLNKCQEEFERGEREQEEANKADEEGEIKQSEEEREEKRIKARRRMLGNIRLIGELYKKKMLTERIMHECIKKLLGQHQNPDEEDVEALCKLMSTIGEIIDHPKAKEHMDAYFDMMTKLSNNMKLSSRVRFMLKDAIDLRKNKWQQRRKVEGPKKIEEVHRDAAQERQAQTSRLSRNTSMNPSPRRGPMDFGPRGSAMLSPPTAQMGGFRGLTSQVRGYGAQDVRMEDRQSYEARTLSVPLPQRSTGDDSITLGPQGGLARGMSIRGPPAVASVPVADIPPGPGDSRRMAAGLNGYSNVSDRTVYGSREDPLPRYVPDRFAGAAAFDQLSAQERNTSYANRDLRHPDRSFDRTLATSPATRMQGQAVTQNTSSEKVWPEERLRAMSMAAIKEFYSARDEKEVALCIKDLNTPSFHQSMISLWVIDSFERKDMERDLLAKLLVNLTKPRDATLSPDQLIKGFDSVLSTLEDAVNDAPKAAEFLGRIFGKVILESVVSLREIGRLLLEGGEGPGRLLEVGLAGDVLGSTLELIKSQKGETVLNEIRVSSKLNLGDFVSPDGNRSRILEKFV